MEQYNFLAFDLGATSGRTILGTLCDNKLTLKELNRFPNKVVNIGVNYYWNICSLYENIVEGIFIASKEGVKISSIGIDTWGVDFVLLGDDGKLLGLPYAYRDPHTKDICDKFFENEMPKEDLYQSTGIQIMNFNTIFQLYAMRQNQCSALKASSTILFMPDALSYMLSGSKVTEYTIASTSQMLNPYKREFDGDILNTLNIDKSSFSPIVMPGTIIGKLLPSIAEECGVEELPIVAVGGHDTASAIVAVPAKDRNFAYLSSGTWSLMGIESENPVISEQSAAWNITNEGGVDGSIRLLKNITGMWILERCIAEWKREGFDYDYYQIVELALSANAFVVMFDPDDELFANPVKMTSAIVEYCTATGQAAPQNHGEYVRSIFESLALKYRYVLEQFKVLADFPIERLHIIGGGSKNRLLNQFTANSISLPVIAGPSEATAIGNIMMQAQSAGLVKDLSSIREVIASTIDTEEFTPSDKEVWQEAYVKFMSITKNENIK